MKYDAILNKNFGLFCKDYYLYDERKIKDISNEKLKDIFPFWENPNNQERQFKNSKVKDFPLLWRKKNKKFKIDKNQILKISNIDNLETYTKTLIPNSFALQVNFTLKAPYYSSDDDEFYIINNPCLKEKVFKVPMMRGSSIKGALLSAARDVVEKEENKIKSLESYFRIFGVGNDEFRNIVEKVDDNSFKLFFMLNSLAINVNNDIKDIFKKYKESKIYKDSKAQKGRAIFYPIYFNKLSLELINPHNRKTKAGTNPIHYEVVPKDSSSQLQIVYIPFDIVTENNEIIKNEADEDLKFLKACIQKALDNGIGAKTKLGWGKANINGDIEEFWSKR